MNRLNSFKKPMVWIPALMLTTIVAGCGGQDPILGTGVKGSSGPAGLTLGLAAPFGISATAGLATAIASSTVNGNVLLDPDAFCNGAPNPVDNAGGIGSCGSTFVPTINGTVISSFYNPSGNIATIKADLNTGFLSLCATGVPAAACSLGGAATIASGPTMGAVAGSALVLGDNLFFPGVYKTTSGGMLITGDLTLDAQGNPDAVFVFQTDSSLDTAAGSASPSPHTRILLVNGAKASNVWWVVASSATIGTFSEFQGNVIAAYSITENQGATSCGRMMAGAWVGGGGAITLGGSNTVSVPGNSSAPASCI